ncbi:hypothetical protein FPQ18DRAFT_391910 [Pyronema domesticum]|nr:hypothetical protein FPQ18DRAFT_391910 [Pyronema domesticum]
MQRNVAHALINTTLDLDHRQKFSNIVYRGGYQMINHFKFRSDAMAMDPFAEFGTPGPVNEMVKNATEILKRNDIPSSPPVKATPPSNKFLKHVPGFDITLAQLCQLFKDTYQQLYQEPDRARSYRRRSCLTDAAIVEVPDIDAPVIFAVVEEPIAIVAIDVDDEAIAATEPATKTHEATATKKENANLKSQEKAATAEVEVSDDEGTGTGASIRWTKDEKEELLNLLSDGTKNYQYWKTQQKKCAENISIKVFRGKRTVSSIINQWKTLKDSDRGKTVPKGRPRKERDVALVSAHDERLEKSAIGTGYNPEEQRQEEVSNPETGSPEGPDHITAGAVARRHDSEEDDPSQDSGTERNDDDSGTEPDPRPPDDGRKHNDESDAGKHKSLAVVVDAPKLARQGRQEDRYAVFGVEEICLFVLSGEPTERALHNACLPRVEATTTLLRAIDDWCKDLGLHPEYSVPDCNNAIWTVVHRFDGPFDQWFKAVLMGHELSRVEHKRSSRSLSALVRMLSSPNRRHSDSINPSP